MGQVLDLRYYWSVLKRRFLALILTAVPVFALVVAIAFLLPPVYKSTARILVESQQIPSDLARSTVTTSPIERMQLIQQRLMTRENLRNVIAKFDLLPDPDKMSISDKVEGIRRATSFEQINFRRPFGSRQASALAFEVSFRANSAELSAKVANEFVTLMLEQNISERQERASGTYSFFEKDVERLSNALIGLESEILAFKSENEASLPDSLEYRRNELLATQERLLDLSRQISTLRDEEKFLRKVLAAGGGLAVDPAAQTPDERLLQDMKREMAQKRAIYAESHPQIRALQIRIEVQEKRVAEAAGAIVDDDGLDVATLLNPTEQRIGSIVNQLGLLEDQRKAMEERQATLESSIADTPRVEIALNVLERNYADLELRYQEARAKQAEAATGERLETNRQAERFEVVEQATIPTSPEKPKRKLILAGGFVASLVLGLGMVGLLEFFDRSIRRPYDLEMQLELRPLAVLPVITTVAERRTRRWRIGLGALTATGSVAAALAAVHVFYLPIDLLFEQAMEKARISGLVELVKSRVEQ